MRRGWAWALGLFGAALIASLLAGATALYLAIETQARVAPPAVAFTPEHIERAVALFNSNDPRRLRVGSPGKITVSQADLDLTARYLSQRFGRTASRLELRAGGASWASSTRLPALPLGTAHPYLNLQLELRVDGAAVSISQLHIGRLPLPTLLANPLAAFALQQLRDNSRTISALLDSITQIQASPTSLQVDYTWRGLPPDAMGSPRWFAEDQARVKAYGQWLATAQVQTLDALLPPLLALAAARSADDTQAVAENRAALIALAMYVNGEPLSALLPSNEPLVPASPRPIRLNGRADSAQHFTVSAALAATAGSPLADAVGLYKEINDARGGSGFSFNDLAADRAGTRLGEQASETLAGARRLQQFMAQGSAVLLPPVDDLPEDLQQADFARRFGSVDGPAVQRLRAVIEERIGALPLYR
ncbi:hypothetical protein [Variovorax sp. HJSM1_2]|uniref:hypothetical protein n=1 Tax=Variovorax sp. HJSM1_2 TaxID=3366263 RepID=UPI003BEE2FEA